MLTMEYSNKINKVVFEQNSDHMINLPRGQHSAFEEINFEINTSSNFSFFVGIFVCSFTVEETITFDRVPDVSLCQCLTFAKHRQISRLKNIVFSH